MSTTLPYSRLKSQEFPREENYYKHHEGSNHVCVMKLFPNCWIEGTPKDYQKFHLRFYFPKKTIANKEQKVNRIIIMINGIDEIDYSTIYDQLGAKFAEYNLASVLLPLPDHLNRHPTNRHPELRGKGSILKPSDEMVREPGIAFERYLQTMREVDILLNHLKPDKLCGSEKTDCSFFKYLFNSRTRISILGYSLGSSVALANFICNPEKYNACFMLNGGFKLSDLRAGKLFSEDPVESQNIWDNIVSGLGKKWQDEIACKIPDLPKPQQKHSKCFNQIYLGSFTQDLKKRMKNHARKILLILGGKDAIIPPDSIKDFEPEKHGLSIFKIPGLDHFLPIEKEWGKWNDVLVNLINSFEENATYELLTHIDIRENLIKLDRKYHLFKKDAASDIVGLDGKKINNQKHKVLFDNLMLASMAYYTKEELIGALNREHKKHLTCQMAFNKKLLSNEDYKSAIDLYLHRSNPEQKMGEILKQKFHVMEHELKKIWKEQKDFYGEFWGD